MRRANGASKKWLADMQGAFYDVLPDGVLTYRDFIIGPLSNPRKGLVVVVRLAEGRVELRVGGSTQQVFSLEQGAAQACDAACLAYFAAFVSLCKKSGAALMTA